MKTQTGIDQLSSIAAKLYQKRIGLLCHAASVDQELNPLLKKIQALSHVEVACLFAPEHGLWGVAQDMESVDSAKDPGSGLLVHSLYGTSLETLKPRDEWLDGLDAIVCDLQDIGSRYYTFVYSIALMMQAAAPRQIPIFLLDRPNPLNGIQVEGGSIQKGFESFVGLYSISNRHGMTLAELLRYFNEIYSIGAELHVVSLKDWGRKSWFDETGLPWVFPSPNMPTLDTAIVYPGACLFEATEISEGRGTTRPFEILGAPFIDPERWVKHALEFEIPGAFLRPLYFKPMFQKHAGKVCGGLQIHLTDRNLFKPYRAGLLLIKTLHDLYPNDFSWRNKPYEFVDDIPAIDLLTGSDFFRKALEEGKSWQKIEQKIEEGKEEFLKNRKEFLIY